MIRSVQFMAVILILAGAALAQAQKEEPATTQPSSTQSSQTTTAPSPEFARLRVYRHRKYAGSALAPSIYVDDKQVARVGNGRRFTMKLSPGTHSIRSDDKSSAIALDAKSGHEYYVRVDEETGFWKGHGKLTMLMPEQGSAEYQLQKPIEEDRKIDKELIEADNETAPAKKDTQK